MQRGRPSIYTPELGLIIANRISNGEHISSIAKDPGMPEAVTIFKWADGQVESAKDFVSLYKRAQRCKALKLTEEIQDIADDGSQDLIATEKGEVVNHELVRRSELRVRTRQWLAAKLMPAEFGDAQQIKLTGSGPNGEVATISTAMTPQEAAALYREQLKGESK